MDTKKRSHNQLGGPPKKKQTEVKVKLRNFDSRIHVGPWVDQYRSDPS